MLREHVIGGVIVDEFGGMRLPTESDIPDQVNYEARMPKDMAEKAETLGAQKAKMDAPTIFVLAALAGAFIALGGMFSTVVATGGVSFGETRLLSGLVFSLGLVLVVVGGAELFTGNNLIVMAWASKRITFSQLLRNWGIVYLGNLAGAMVIAMLVFGSGQHTFGGGAVGEKMLSIAAGKASIGFGQAICLGILCNVLVCLAVWLAFSARSTTDRILAVILPVAAFVAGGFEHCVANMYFLPLGLFVKGFAGEAFWQSIGTTASAYDSLTVSAAAINNLLPVTIGNVIGGAGMVGLVYWFVYLRKRAK